MAYDVITIRQIMLEMRKIWENCQFGSLWRHHKNWKNFQCQQKTSKHLAFHENINFIIQKRKRYSYFIFLKVKRNLSFKFKNYFRKCIINTEGTVTWPWNFHSYVKLVILKVTKFYGAPFFQKFVINKNLTGDGEPIWPPPPAKIELKISS